MSDLRPVEHAEGCAANVSGWMHDCDCGAWWTFVAKSGVSVIREALQSGRRNAELLYFDSAPWDAADAALAALEGERDTREGAIRADERRILRAEFRATEDRCREVEARLKMVCEPCSECGHVDWRELEGAPPEWQPWVDAARADAECEALRQDVVSIREDVREALVLLNSDRLKECDEILERIKRRTIDGLARTAPSAPLTFASAVHLIRDNLTSLQNAPHEEHAGPICPICVLTNRMLAALEAQRDG